MSVRDHDGEKVAAIMSDSAKRNPKSYIRLPIHLKWSGPTDYDLSDPSHKRYVYEIVLREGGERDVKEFINPDELLDMWKDITLPRNVRTAWANWFRLKRGLDLPV